MIIKDNLLGKYEIKWDDSFTLVENGIAIDAKTGEEKPKQTVIGYYSTLEGALRQCVILLTKESFPETATLSEIIEKFQSLWLEITNTIVV